MAASASATASAKQIQLQVTVPEPNAKAGIGGTGWTVDVIAKGSGPAMDKIKPAFSTSSSTGRNPAFPGLVIMIQTKGTSGQATDSKTNLARLFQIIGLPNTLGGSASISSVTSAPSASPAATASGAASASAAGTAATRTTTTDNETAEATWFVQQLLWGTDVDVELTAFVVDGDAPDIVTDKTKLNIVSNEATVTFHINGNASPTSSGTPRPSASGSASPSGSASGTPRPSASPSSTP